MSLFSDVAERVRALLFRKRQERDLADELEFHLERDTEERMRRGASPVEARRAALLAMRGVERTKEDVRDARGVRPLQDLMADLRYTIRSLRRDPIYAIATIVVLGVGLGAGTTVLAVAESVFFSSLPYRDAHRLVRVGQLYQQNETIWQLSTVDVQAIQEQQRSFQAFGIVNWNSAALSGDGPPERVPIGRVDAGFFEALEVEAAEGRVIASADEAPDAAPVVVVSHRLAERRFGSIPRALGRTLTLDGSPHAIIGVLPPDRDRLAGVRADAWPVLKLRAPERRGPFWLRGIGRLRDGVTLEDASRDLAAIGERIFPLWASSFQDRTARITPMLLRDTIVGQATKSVSLFGAAVAMVLLIAVVNVATLSLVRASAREPELALRVTLGAGRLRLARLPLVEGLTVGAAAGVVGLALAAVGIRLLVRFGTNLPRVEEVALTGSTVGSAVIVALLCGILVNASPALTALGTAVQPSSRGDLRRTGVDRRTTKLRGALVVTEFALAFPLLVGASLLFRSFLHVQEVDPGFDPAGIVSISVALPSARYAEYQDVQQFWRQVEQAVINASGVSGAGVSTELPPTDAGNVNNFNLIDRPVAPGVAEHLAPWVSVTPGYFNALGIPLLEGRMFNPADSGSAPPVVLVSRSWAARYYPGESAVGRQMVSGGCTECPPTTVIGVVENVKYLGLTQDALAVYEPLEQAQPRRAHVVVHTATTPAITFAALREVVASLDSELPVEEETMVARIDDALLGPERSTVVLSGFAVASALLAALGIFGLMSYTVRRRQREIGVRIALGAKPGAIMQMIVGRGMRYAVMGTAIGLGLTVFEARWLEGFLYAIAPTDPTTIAMVASALLFVAALACGIPGWQASRIDPVTAISTE